MPIVPAVDCTLLTGLVLGSGMPQADRDRLPNGASVHVFRTPLEDLSSMVQDLCRTRCDEDAPTFAVVTTPTSSQRRALDLLKRIA